MPCKALFLPDQGMALASFTKGAIEVIDQGTRTAFNERRAGLGVLIGPHFHRRKSELVPKINEDAFPHIAYCREHGIEDPFSHGVSRYAPWKAELKDGKIVATLSGKESWNGVLLKDIEGQNFEMTFTAELIKGSLHLVLSVVSDSDSIAGLHYYYNLPDGKGRIMSRVKSGPISVELDRSHDETYHAFPDPLHGTVLLETSTYSLRTTFHAVSAENCWQLYHPEGAHYVCIEPMSAWDPRHPNLTASSINVELCIL